MVLIQPNPLALYIGGVPGEAQEGEAEVSIIPDVALPDEPQQLHRGIPGGTDELTEDLKEE
eukprot:12880864-Prorocentrum_lima.AAC.1